MINHNHKHGHSNSIVDDYNISVLLYFITERKVIKQLWEL